MTAARPGTSLTMTTTGTLNLCLLLLVGTVCLLGLMAGVAYLRSVFTATGTNAARRRDSAKTLDKTGGALEVVVKSVSALTKVIAKRVGQLLQ